MCSRASFNYEEDNVVIYIEGRMIFLESKMPGYSLASPHLDTLSLVDSSSLAVVKELQHGYYIAHMIFTLPIFICDG